MKIKGYVIEDMTNYGYKPSMLIAMARCSFKCDVLNGCKVCQNSRLAYSPDIEMSNQQLINIYQSSGLHHALIFAGLEPLDQFSELITFIKDFREVCDDLIIIYTGYTDSDASITGQRQLLASFPNIIVKWGRFIMNQPHHTDPILGVKLASPNQYAERIS